MNIHPSSVNWTEADIMERLACRGRRESRAAGSAAPDHPTLLTQARPAAVLVPLVRMPADAAAPGWHILFTRRTDWVKDHKGQVCFPGGRSDPEDLSPEATALRETFEEIGLKVSDVRVLARMDPLVTITNYLVTPVVGVVPWPYAFNVEPKEVSRVFTIPIDWLADSTHYEIRQRELPPDFPIPPQFRNLEVICFRPYDDEVLWGATAEITLRLVERLAKPLEG